MKLIKLLKGIFYILFEITIIVIKKPIKWRKDYLEKRKPVYRDVFLKNATATSLYESYRRDKSIFSLEGIEEKSGKKIYVPLVEWIHLLNYDTSNVTFLEEYLDKETDKRTIVFYMVKKENLIWK